jgi:hypothetical protein
MSCCVYPCEVPHGSGHAILPYELGFPVLGSMLVQLGARLGLKEMDLQEEVQVHKTVRLVSVRCDAIGQCIFREHAVLI